MDHLEQTIAECRQAHHSEEWMNLHKTVINEFWISFPKITTIAHSSDDNEFYISAQYAEALLVQLRYQLRVDREFNIHTYLMFNTKLKYVCDRLIKMDYSESLRATLNEG